MPSHAKAPNRRLRMAALVGLVIATVGAAAAAGWADLHSGSSQPSVMLVAGAAFALTVLFLRGGWLGGLLVGFGVPLAHLYAYLARYQLPYPYPHPLASIWALVPGVAGVITGLAVHAGVAHIKTTVGR